MSHERNLKIAATVPTPFLDSLGSKRVEFIGVPRTKKGVVTGRVFFLTLGFVASSLFFSCDESLPSRDEPRKFLKAAINVKPLFVRVDIDSNGIPPFPERISGVGGSLELTLQSFYNEVLQDQAQVRGTVDLWLASRPDIRATVTMTEGDVDYPVFDPDGLLTLAPGDSVHLAKQWSHLTDNGRAFLRYVPLRISRDPTGRTYYESAPVRFNAQATLQVFRNVQPERTPVYEFELVYHIYVIYPP